jgi:hypothetical protein
LEEESRTNPWALFNLLGGLLVGYLNPQPSTAYEYLKARGGILPDAATPESFVGTVNIMHLSGHRLYPAHAAGVVDFFETIYGQDYIATKKHHPDLQAASNADLLSKFTRANFEKY